ncbi:MAG: CRISPR-associated endonuclease Cas1 [Saprospiraceae bacterium]
MQLIIDTQGTNLNKRNNCFQISNETSERIIAPSRIQSIAISNNCMISSAAVELAILKNIPIYFIDKYGDVVGRLWSSQLSHTNQLRRLQLLALERDDFRILSIKEVFDFKTVNQVSILKQLSKAYGNKDVIRTTILDIESLRAELQNPGSANFEEARSRMMGYEGSIAKLYWKVLSQFLEPYWQFSERSRRPAKDPFNALLNYNYGMLYHVVEQGIFACGLDPTFGFMHRDQTDKPTLSFDLIEPFRPWIDFCLIENIKNGNLCQDACIKDSTKGFIISKAEKRKLIQSFNAEMLKEREFLDRRMSVRDHIHRYAGLHAESIRKIMNQKLDDDVQDDTL